MFTSELPLPSLFERSQKDCRFMLHFPAYAAKLPALNRLHLVSLRGESSGEFFSVVI
jgi:hypothetical protein